MKRDYGIVQVAQDARSVVTVGSFDGVHLGHRTLIHYLIERARARDGVSVVLSFDPHPREVLSGRPVPLLTTIEERADALEALGLDRFIVLPFTSILAGMSAQDFVENILLRRIGLREIVIGYDHGFGKDREGDSKLLQSLGNKHGFAVDVVPARLLERDVVSSTRIRQALSDEGDVELASRLLGRAYRLTGKVITGDGRGRKLGYPTANIQVNHPNKIIPHRGVYAVRISIEGRQNERSGMLNVGSRPTFNGEGTHLEAHLFDFEESLYDKILKVDFVQRIRDEQKFTSVEALVEQLSMDERRCRAILESST